MAVSNLTESAWQRAKKDAAAAIKMSAFGIAAAIVGTVFAAAALVVAEGEPATTQAGASIFFGVLSMGVTLALIFLVQLAAAPVRQRNELRASFGTAEVGSVNVDLMLRNAHRRGNELAQRLEARTSGVSLRQRQEAEAWTEEVVALLAVHAPESVGQRFIAAGSNETKTLPRLRSRVDILERLIDELG